MAPSPCTRQPWCLRQGGHRGICSKSLAGLAVGTFRAKTTTTTSARTGPTGGTTMSDIQQAKAALLAASTKLNEASGALQQGHSDTEEALGLLLSGMEGTSQADFDECRALIADATAKAYDARSAAALASDSAQGMAGRL